MMKHGSVGARSHFEQQEDLVEQERTDVGLYPRFGMPLIHLSILALLLPASCTISTLRLDDWDTVEYSLEPHDAPRQRVPADPSRASGVPANTTDELSQTTGGGILVAEFAPMQAVLVRYPLGLPASLVAAFSHDLHVVVLCQSWLQGTATKVLANAGAFAANLTFVDVKTDSYWTRDYGPWYVGSEATGNWSIVDFEYNRDRPNDNAVSQQLATLWGVPYANSGLTLTGGNMMGDGKGTGSATYLVYEDNGCGSKPCTKVDDAMKASYGIDTFLTIADPTGNYIEHMDCWGKFLSDDDVLVDRPPPSSRYAKQYDAAADFFAAKGWKVHRVDISGEESDARTRRGARRGSGPASV